MGMLRRVARRLSGTGSPEQEFADTVAKRIRRQPGVQRVEQAENFALLIYTADAGSPMELNLSTIYAESRGLTSAEQREAIDATIAVMFRDERPPKDWAPARTQLRPVLRTVSYGQGYGTPPELWPVFRPFAPMMAEMLVIDFDGGMSFVTAEQLAAWDVTADDALLAAAENLAATPTRIGQLQPADGGMLFVGDEHPYVSSLLLVPGWLDGLRDQFGLITPIAAVPGRDVLLMADATNQAATAFLLAEAADIYTNHPRPVSPAPYALGEDGAIVPWHPEPLHPSHSAAERAHRLLACDEYNAQRAHLTELFAKAGEDVHVAALTLKTDAVTVTTWARDTDALLPAADRIQFDGDYASEAFELAWRDADEILTGEWEDAGLTPPRMRTLHRPAEDVMRSLRERAV